MERILEPEVMDGQEQSDAYARADFAAVNQAFVERFCDLFPDQTSGRFIDLGCGPADIPVRLCRALPGVTVCAIDASPPMLALALQAVRDEGLDDRIELVEGYVPVHLSPPRRFDAVISNSLLHHLPDPDALWRQLADVASQGACVLVVDLMRPDSREAAEDIVQTYAADEPEVLRTDFYCSLLAAFTPQEVQAQLDRHPALADLRVHVISDRHLAVWGHCR